MDFEDENENDLPLCSPIPETAISSPNPKKLCSVKQDEHMSNADILKAIQELTCRFISIEKKICQNTADIITINENIEGIDHEMKTKMRKNTFCELTDIRSKEKNRRCRTLQSSLESEAYGLPELSIKHFLIDSVHALVVTRKTEAQNLL